MAPPDPPYKVHEKLMKTRSYKPTTPSSEQIQGISKTMTQRTPQTAPRGRSRGGKTPNQTGLPAGGASATKPTGTIPKTVLNPVVNPKAAQNESDPLTLEGKRVNNILNNNLGTSSMEDLRGAGDNTEPQTPAPQNQNTGGLPSIPEKIDPNPELLYELQQCRAIIKQLTLQCQAKQNTERPRYENSASSVYQQPQRTYVEQGSDSDSSHISNVSQRTSQVGARNPNRVQDRGFVRCEIGKWPIKFKGGNGVKFFKKVNKLQASYGYSDETIFKYFHLLLEGHAMEWYWQYSDQYPDANYAHFKSEFVRVFRPIETDMALVSQMYARKQGKDSFDSFYNDIVDLNFSLKEPLSDIQLIEILRNNVDDEVRQRIFTFQTRDRIQFYHTANLAYKDVCKSREKRRPFVDSRFSKKSVNEIDFDEMSPNEIEEVSVKFNNWKSKRASMKCFNCNSGDHLLAKCPEEIDRFFCFRCGKDGVATPKCPNCTLNLRRGVE